MKNVCNSYAKTSNLHFMKYWKRKLCLNTWTELTFPCNKNVSYNERYCTVLVSSRLHQLKVIDNKCRRRHQAIYLCRLLLWYKHLRVKKNSREQSYRSRANFLPWSNLPGGNFLGDTIPGGNFPAGNIPCWEYKQDHFLVRVGTTIKD